MNLKDKTYIVTGGSSGLGKAMAVSLKNEGAKVVITGRDQSKLDTVASEIGVQGFHADVNNDADIEALYGWVKDNFGKLDKENESPADL